MIAAGVEFTGGGTGRGPRKRWDGVGRWANEEAAMRLAGKVALISGGARGMGAAEARLFAQEGARIVIGDILEGEGAAVAAGIGAKGGEAVFVRLDVTSESDWERAVATAERRFGRLDVLGNNAGLGGGGAGAGDAPRG